MDDQQYLATFEELLGHLVLGGADTSRIQAASNALNTQYYDQARCVPALVELMNRSEHWQVRQLAAVELRKRTARWWADLDAATKSNIRARLLESVMKESDVPVRNAVSRAISSIAQEESIKTDWPDLLPFLHRCITEGNAGQREVGVYVLYTLLEVIVDYSPDQLQQLLNVFSQTLVDPESKEIRVTTLQAISTLAECVEPDNKDQVRQLQEMVPVMVNVMQQCIAENDQAGLAKGFDSLDSMLVLSAPVLTRQLPQLIEFSFGVGGNQSLDESVRVMALSFLLLITIYRKSRVLKAKLVTPMIQHLMPIATEDDPEDIDDDSPSRTAVRIIQSLAANMPPTQVFPPLLQMILEYMASANAGQRKAAMMAFAASIEGCAEFMRSKIDDLMQLIFAGLRDPELKVRHAACLALSCVADEIEEAVTNNHTTLLPLIFDLVGDSSPELTKRACGALASILENLGEDIMQYLPVLMEKLVYLIDATEGEMRATVVNTLASAAQTAGKEFTPYFPQVMARLQTLMSHVGEQEEDMVLRGVATDATGAVAVAVGKEVFAPYLESTMKMALDGLQLQGPRLRETSYSFFTLMASVFGEDMAPYLPVIVPQLLQTCAQDETNGVELVNEADEISLGDDNLEEDDEDEDGGWKLNTALGDEKEVAADAMGELMEATLSHFMPYAPDCLKALVELLDHYSDGVRKSAISALLKFVAAVNDMATPEGAKWTAGLPLQQPVHDNVAGVIQVVMRELVKAWKEEDDKMVVAVIQQELAETLKRVGPALIADHVTEINRLVLELFEGKAFCQVDDDDDDEEFDVEDKDAADAENQTEYDSVLISATSDMLGAQAVALGANFVDYFRVYLPYLAKYSEPNRSSWERSMAVGCMGEVSTGLKAGITEFTETVFSVALRALQDPENSVRSDAAFTIGALCQHTTLDVTSQYPAVLQALSPLLQCSLPNAIDNACGAIARLITAHPEAASLEEVLPVLIQHLPLRVDYAEYAPILGCLIPLIRNGHPAIAAHVPALRALFANLLSAPDTLLDEQRAELTELCQQLGA